MPLLGPKKPLEIEMSGSIVALRPEVTLALLTIFVAFSGVFLICFMKGAFGGGSPSWAFRCCRL
jgi:hypothetical protein